MPDKGKLIAELLLVAEKAGLTEIAPIELSSGGNLIVHLAPHPVVARIAIVLSQEDEDAAYRLLERELRAARHLHARGVPVLLPTDDMDAGPRDIGGIWTTFWKYAAPAPLQPPSPGEAVELVHALTLAMEDFACEIPQLGVWERTCQSAARLMDHADERVQALLKRFVQVDKRMRLETKLFPCHGDAHRGNLLPSPEGWIWADFEDLSRMPAYWDLASWVANPALFGGVEEPTFRYIWNRLDNRTELEAFGFAITARILMSTLGNLDFALAGNGDLDFAMQQLALAGDFLTQIELLISYGNGTPV
ncbi:phosphotransferase [Paenibacillus rhizovicinus]|uniref:Phosphotransferase n=1 Tax=Paenibacillus rhizovicinus TaxID=2704463 RepID=A0A6C0NXC4_9BACL|nr:phosphotransferase [Paenibacillus rhizovicinus]QHW30895.1 phosphotransferase [Paenibacillus rhizovicinus]